MELNLRYKLARYINEQFFFVRQGYGCAILAGNSNLRTDPAIEFHPRAELAPVTLAAAWRTGASNPGIQTVIGILSKLIAASAETKTW